jgi:hypothetical protein
MKRNNLLKLLIALIVIVVILLAFDIGLRLNCKPTSRESSQHMVIPIGFMYKYPDCTKKLVEETNLTNIHMVPPGTLEQKRLMQSGLYKISHQRLLTDQTKQSSRS